jgi:hypothetical protein
VLSVAKELRLTQQSAKKSTKRKAIERGEALPPFLKSVVPEFHTQVWGKVWLQVLQLPLSPSDFKRVLMVIPDKVLPHMHRPVMLMDFFTDSYEAGGILGMLALHGLFILITKHNLYVAHHTPHCAAYNTAC